MPTRRQAQRLPGLWLINVATIVVLYALVLAVLCVILIALALRWLYRIVRRWQLRRRSTR